MSRWGEGNFDDDHSWDCLVLLIDQLADTVRNCLAEEEYLLLLYGENRLMPCVDIMLTLGTAYPEIAVSRIQELPIGEWKTKYLAVFDREGDDIMDERTKARCRAVIVDTFSRLARLELD